MDKSLEVKMKNHVSQKKSADIKMLMKYFDTTSEESNIFYQDVFKGCAHKDNDSIDAEYEEIAPY